MGAFITHSRVRCTMRSTQHEKPILFGRDAELAHLDIACSDPYIPLLLLIAPAGTGKTALLHHWLGRCESADWQGMDAVIGWSFSSEIKNDDDDDSQAILREFLEYVLAWLGVVFSAEQTCTEKAGLLVRQLQQQRVLLILDHIPAAMLQEKPEHSELSACLYVFLKPLMNENPGFCLLVLEEDIVFGYGGVAGGHSLHLRNLTQADGVNLLAHQGVQGSVKALGKVSALFDHHPLTLTLLGPYLKDACAGDLGKLDSIPIWLDPQASGRQSRRLLAAYEHWLAKTPELALVYMLSLFDGSISTGRLLDLCHRGFRRRFFFIRQHIPTILLPLGRLNSKKLLHLQQRLHNLHLLAAYTEPDILELHSVIREYFAQKFQVRFMGEWKHLRELLAANHAESIALPPSILSEPEPISVMEGLLAQAIEAKHWQQAADFALQLHKRTLIDGNITMSVNYARQSVAYAHLGGDMLHLQQNLQVLTELLQQIDTATSVVEEVEVATMV